MNEIKATYEIKSNSVILTVEISAQPQMGIDYKGTFKKASQADCANAMALMLDAIEASEHELVDAIEKEINGTRDDEQQED